MGSPTVAADMLHELVDASRADGSIFEVSAVVTQPPSHRLRGRKQIPSPVAQRALDMSFPADRIFTPERAGEEMFLADLRALKPDLCVTAAYGNILPKRFLEIPQHGTVNVHPSLLPLYRGAAPVQRALQDGVKVTGVSVAFTVYALDAGPIIAAESMEIDDSIKSSTELLCRHLNCSPFFLIEVSVEESWLCFDQPALMLHNKVRAFAGWPGTRTKVQISNGDGNGIDDSQILEIKIVTTKVGSKYYQGNEATITFDRDALIFCCGGGSTLEVLELQPPGKRIMSAQDFWNGLRGRKLLKA